MDAGQRPFAYGPAVVVPIAPLSAALLITITMDGTLFLSSQSFLLI